MSSSFMRRLVAIGWPIAEIVLLWALAQAVGWGWVLLIIVGGVVAAAAVLSATLRHFREAVSGLLPGKRFTTVDPDTGDATTVLPPQATGPQPVDERRLREGGLLLSSAIMLAVPGLISDAVGLIVLLPPVRRRLLARPPRRAPTGRVVRGETLYRPDANTESTGPDARPGTDAPPPGSGSGPRTIPGQILPPSADRPSQDRPDG